MPADLAQAGADRLLRALLLEVRRLAGEAAQLCVTVLGEPLADADLGAHEEIEPEPELAARQEGGRAAGEDATPDRERD